MIIKTTFTIIAFIVIYMVGLFTGFNYGITYWNINYCSNNPFGFFYLINRKKNSKEEI